MRVEVHLPRVLESRSAGQRALAPPTDGRTSARLSEASTLIQPLYNHFLTPTRTRPTATQPQPYPQPFPQPSSNRFPTPHQPSGTSTHPQPFFSRQTDDSALDKHPRLNHPSCRIQERFRHNHPSFVILQLRLNHNHNKTGARHICRVKRNLSVPTCAAPGYLVSYLCFREEAAP